jgi:2-keto-3-deoxy-L-rhamnonate aldolase RhmA
VPIVRVPWLGPGILMKALDAGAYGVARARVALGYRFVTLESDARLLSAGSQELLGAMRA